jgi:hypothetical protein
VSEHSLFQIVFAAFGTLRGLMNRSTQKPLAAAVPRLVTGHAHLNRFT